MNWTDLIPTLIKLGAPLIGGALGGPLGGAAGKILADQLGVENTPEAVNEAINDPANAAAIANADAEWAKAAGIIAQSKAAQAHDINETIRAEIAAQQGTISWYHWRHLLGYVVGGWVLGVGAAFTKHMWFADATAIASVMQLLNSGFGYFGAACGLLGYVAMDNTRRTSSAMTADPAPTIIGAVIKGLTGKKK